MQSNGVVFYTGPSMFDGRAIRAVATGIVRASENTKTGDLVQTWIAPVVVDPVTAVKTGADSAVCGDCKRRPALGGDCYVNVGHAPSQTWQATDRGAYLQWSADLAPLFRGRILRLGSWGDPCAVPFDAWRPLIDACASTIGYTHQWSRCNLRWRRYLMASVDSEAERAEAKRWGWRTFRARPHEEPLAPAEIECPASERAGKRRTCETCRACSGSLDSPRAVDVSIEEHGPRVRMRRRALSLVTI